MSEILLVPLWTCIRSLFARLKTFGWISRGENNFIFPSKLDRRTKIHPFWYKSPIMEYQMSVLFFLINYCFSRNLFHRRRTFTSFDNEYFYHDKFVFFAVSLLKYGGRLSTLVFLKDNEQILVFVDFWMLLSLLLVPNTQIFQWKIALLQLNLHFGFQYKYEEIAYVTQFFQWLSVYH